MVLKGLCLIVFNHSGYEKLAEQAVSSLQSLFGGIYSSR